MRNSGEEWMNVHTATDFYFYFLLFPLASLLFNISTSTGVEDSILTPTSYSGGGSVRYGLLARSRLEVFILLLIDHTRPPSLSATEKVPHDGGNKANSLRKQKRTLKSKKCSCSSKTMYKLCLCNF